MDMELFFLAGCGLMFFSVWIYCTRGQALLYLPRVKAKLVRMASFGLGGLEIKPGFLVADFPVAALAHQFVAVAPH